MATPSPTMAPTMPTLAPTMHPTFEPAEPWEWYQITFVIFMIIFFCVGCVYVLEPQNIAKSVRNAVRTIRGLEDEIDEPQPAPKKKPVPVVAEEEKVVEEEKIEVKV